MKTLHSEVMTIANKLRKQGLNKSEALKTAWAEIKSKYPSDIKSQTDELKPVDAMTTLEKVQEYKKLQNIIDTIEERMEQIKQSVIDEMEQQQVDELKIDIFKVRYITVISNRFNTTEFKKTHEQLYAQYLKESKSKRFTIAC